MRTAAGLLVLALGACGADRQPDRQTGASAPASAVDIATVAKATPAQSSPLLAIPKDPAALKRLEAMGYTVHEDHLHAPGVTSCPRMGNDPVL